MRCMVRPIAAVLVTMLLIAIGCGSGESGPPELRTGRSIYADHCATCHGNRGQGGVGPALDHVLATWPSCDDQQRWISLGSEGWKELVGPTYGATDTEIDAVMPGQADLLTDREIAMVAAFERVEYGGGEPSAVLADCGLADG